MDPYDSDSNRSINHFRNVSESCLSASTVQSTGMRPSNPGGWANIERSTSSLNFRQGQPSTRLRLEIVATQLRQFIHSGSGKVTLFGCTSAARTRRNEQPWFPCTTTPTSFKVQVPTPPSSSYQTKQSPLHTAPMNPYDNSYCNVEFHVESRTQSPSFTHYRKGSTLTKREILDIPPVWRCQC